MAWRHYVLRFRLLSPLHIGDRKIGNLMQTRPYVTGRVLWAALTARLTRDLGRETSGMDYRGIGAQIKKNFRFGYLWPSLDGKTPYFPWDHDDFEYLLLGSYVSTAIDYDRQAAQEGSLHEVEFIAPVARDGRPVYLIGDLWVRNVLPSGLQSWQEALNRLQLGGERTYGWGRVRLSDPQLLEGSRHSTIGGNVWEEREGEVVLKLGSKSRLCAHALAAKADVEAKADESHPIDPLTDLRGPIELLVGLETDEKGRFGAKSSPAYVCWKPGLLLSKPIEALVWREFGILVRAS